MGFDGSTAQIRGELTDPRLFTDLGFFKKSRYFKVFFIKGRLIFSPCGGFFIIYVVFFSMRSRFL